MDEIEIKFTLQERDLIIHHTLADPELTRRLTIAEIRGKHLITKYTLYDLDDLLIDCSISWNTSLKNMYEKLSHGNT